MNRLERIYAISRQNAELIQALASEVVDVAEKEEYHSSRNGESDRLSTWYRGQRQALVRALRTVMYHVEEGESVTFSQMSGYRTVVIGITLSGFRCPKVIRQDAQEYDHRHGRPWHVTVWPEDKQPYRPLSRRVA